MDKYEVGIITDSELGCNFAMRLKETGYSCVLYHTGIEKMSRDEINKYVAEMQKQGIHTSTSMEITLSLLDCPRRIFIVSRSANYSEKILDEIHDFADEHDIIIDTCDADYNTTASRCRLFEKKNVSYLGVGFSGEATKLLNGTSLMVGGSRDAYEEVYDMLQDISSKYKGEGCCAYIGPDGAGQYAKMIHNGIEYGVMQSIVESISMLERIEDFDDTLVFEILNEWVIGENESFLLQAAIEIISKKEEETGKLFKDFVSDKVGNSKSVLWLCASAAELAEPVPSIYAALGHRFVSGMKKERTALAALVENEKYAIRVKQREKKVFLADVRNSLYLSAICIHAQAFNLLKHRSSVGIWGTSALDVAMTFQGGAFIRSRLLTRIIDAYQSKPDLKNLLEDPYFVAVIKRYLPSLKNIVSTAAENGIIVPVFSATLSYILSMTEENMNTGMIELLRDYIQGTGFELNDSSKKRYIADWNNPADVVLYKEIKK